MADNELQLLCPACGKPMKKIFIKSANCNVDVCLDGCGGIYFDNREFKKMDEVKEEIPELIEVFENFMAKEVNLNVDRICPVCGHKMIKHFASAKNEIEIDDCYTCGGIFLDNNELLKIRAQFKTEAERQEHFNQTFNSRYGYILSELDKKLEENKKNRSIPKKIFDSVFNSIYLSH